MSATFVETMFRLAGKFAAVTMEGTRVSERKGEEKEPRKEARGKVITRYNVVDRTVHAR